jgi:hypothetical protein
MALSVIGSGFGRTGTMSLKMALEQLGLGPCHHMEEVGDHPQQLDYWRAVVRGENVNWDAVFQNYGCCVDWPSAHYWRQLAEKYPDAKVLHSTRAAEGWWASFSKTIAMVIAEAGSDDPEHEIRNVPELANAVIAEQTFNGQYNDKQVAIAAFEQRERDVRAAIPADRLLVFDVREGWGPLCEFLELPVPEGPFPRSNNQQEFRELVQSMMDKNP